MAIIINDEAKKLLKDKKDWKGGKNNESYR